MSEHGSIVESWEKFTFPNVVGCDLDRAKCMIRFWLKVKVGYDEEVHFSVYDHKARRALLAPQKDSFGNDGEPKVLQRSKEIILWYDYKYDAVAITPIWFGTVAQINNYSEDEWFEGRSED